MNKIIKKTISAVAGAALVAGTIGISNAADDIKSNISTKVDANSTNVQRHYDPAHMGHSHQCANCKKTYNQQGDNGQYSSGSNICPYCGFANQMPPSPNNPYTPPAPYTPPTPPPYVPPSPYTPPAPNYGENVDELLRLYDRASNYRDADNLIVAASSRIYSLRDLCRLAVKAYYRESTAAITNNFSRPNVIADVTPDELITYWNKCSNYQTADMIAVAAGKKLTSIKAILRVSVVLYYKASWQDLINYVDMSCGRLFDPPAISDLRFYWGKASNYELADRILLAGARYLRTISELGQAAEIAYYSSTKRAIEAMYSQVQGPSPYSNYPGQFGRAVEQPLEGADGTKIQKTTKKVSANIEIVKLNETAVTAIKEATDELSQKDTSFDLTSDDIKNLNIEKISTFSEKYQSGSLKNSDFLKLTKENLKKRLKDAALSNPEMLEFLNKIK